MGIPESAICRRLAREGYADAVPDVNGGGVDRVVKELEAANLNFSCGSDGSECAHKRKCLSCTA
jgi:hypothetical protein